MNLKNFITNIDATPVSYSVSFNKRTQYQTFACGIISIILWIVILFIAVDKIISIFERNEMYLSSVKERSWTQTTLIDLNMKMLVQIQNSNVIITKDNQFQHGLNITYSEYHQQENSSLSVTNYPLSNESYFFVFPSNFEPTIEGPTRAVQDESEKKYFQLQIRFCDQTNSSCKKIKTSYILNVKIDFDRPMLNLQRNQKEVEMSEVESFQTINMSSLVETGRRKIFYIERITLKLDDSILPSIPGSQQKIQTWYYDFKTENQELNLIEKQKILQSYSFRRDDQTTNYQRSYKKIDTGIAEVFGLFSFATLIMMLFSSHYKNWAKNITLSEDVGSREIKEINMKNYIEYVKNKQEENEQFEKEIQHHISRLDIVKLRQDIDKLDEKVHMICERTGIPSERIYDKQVVEMEQSSDKLGKNEPLKQSLLNQKEK